MRTGDETVGSIKERLLRAACALGLPPVGPLRPLFARHPPGCGCPGAVASEGLDPLDAVRCVLRMTADDADEYAREVFEGLNSWDGCEYSRRAVWRELARLDLTWPPCLYPRGKLRGLD